MNFEDFKSFIEGDFVNKLLEETRKEVDNYMKKLENKYKKYGID